MFIFKKLKIWYSTEIDTRKKGKKDKEKAIPKVSTTFAREPAFISVLQTQTKLLCGSLLLVFFAEMEVAVAKALKPSLRREFVFQQALCEEILCLNANNGVGGEDFSVDDLLDFSNSEFQLGSVEQGDVRYEEEEDDDEEKDNSSFSSQSQDRGEDDSNSNFTGASGAGDSESIFASELMVPADDLADLEWVSRFVDDSLPELSLLYPVRSEQTNTWVQPEPKACSEKTPPFPSEVPVKARTTKSRKPNARICSFSPVLSRPSSPSSCSSVFSSPAPVLFFAGSAPNVEFLRGDFCEPPPKKQKKKTEAKTDGPQLQRRCSHCQVQKTPQWRTGPLGAKTLCNACGVRYKSGRLFSEYRPACSPTFSSDVHSNSHRKVLEIRRRKETAGLEASSAPTQLVPSC